jgi:hypothetical protein
MKALQEMSIAFVTGTESAGPFAGFQDTFHIVKNQETALP